VDDHIADALIAAGDRMRIGRQADQRALTGTRRVIGTTLIFCPP